MMRWMSSYSTPCALSCCHSVDCASIRCDGCSISFTAHDARHTPRYVCTSCPLVQSSSFSGSKFEVPLTTLCGACYASVAVPHEHASLFCLIDSTGLHTPSERPVLPTPKFQLSLSDLRVVPADERGGRGVLVDECYICCEAFSPFSPAVAQLGCRSGKAHSHSVRDKKRGVADQGAFCCATCYMRELGEGAKAFPGECRCLLCCHEKEMEKWQMEFVEELNTFEIGSFEELVGELMALHPQPWIKQLLTECAESVRLQRR